MDQIKRGQIVCTLMLSVLIVAGFASSDVLSFSNPFEALSDDDVLDTNYDSSEEYENPFAGTDIERELSLSNNDEAYQPSQNDEYKIMDRSNLDTGISSRDKYSSEELKKLFEESPSYNSESQSISDWESDYEMTEKDISYMNSNYSGTNNYSLPFLEERICTLRSDGIEISADSNLDNDHNVDKLIDGNFKTAWSEGDDGLGIGSTISLKGNSSIVGIRIFSGFLKSQDLLEKNGYPTSIEIKINGDTYSFDIDREKSCDNAYGQELLFGKHYNIDENYMTIKILGAEEGTKYQDVCISEIQLIGASIRTDNSEFMYVEGISDIKDGKEKTTYSGVTEKGKAVWSYKTDYVEITELGGNQCFELLDRVYIISNGITVLDRFTGEKIWSNSYVVGGADMEMDTEGNIYITGYYGPLLLKMDSNGEIIYEIEDEDYYWSSDISIDEKYIYIKVNGYPNGDGDEIRQLVYTTDGDFVKFE